MILMRATWKVPTKDRPRVLAALRRLLEPNRALPGCVQCHAFTNIEDPFVVSYFEEWADSASLDAHLRSDSVRVLLSAMELASAAPVVRFETLSDTRGIEVIAMARAGSE